LDPCLAVYILSSRRQRQQICLIGRKRGSRLPRKPVGIDLLN
jgi:hypothetical protein